MTVTHLYEWTALEALLLQEIQYILYECSLYQVYLSVFTFSSFWMLSLKIDLHIILKCCAALGVSVKGVECS